MPFISAGQTSSPFVKINKLVVDSRKSYDFIQGDSTTSVIIDTLIMKDKSRLFFVNKKKVSLVVNYAVIGKDCVLEGNDSKNNGTDLNFNVNFAQLNSLFIDVSGKDARSANRHFDNGNGGKVVLNYLASGKKPQTADKKEPAFVSVKNRAGGYTVNPQSDIAVLMGQMRNGSGGRPLGQLPNGRVYSGSVGRDGTIVIKPVSNLN